MAKKETLLEFPCPFSVKAMGLACDEFKHEVYDLLKDKIDGLKLDDLKVKPSKTGKYHSVTVSFSADSKKQLDEIYQILTDCESVVMAL